MKKFQYRMEPLLKQRKHIEEEKQKILATAQKKIIDQKNELSEIIDSQKDVCDSQVKKTSRSTFVVSEMLMYARFVQKLKKDTIVGQEMLKVLNQDEDKKRKDLLRASQERKKYEKLKEIQQKKYYEVINEEEKKESDEIALNIFRYNKINSM